MLPLRHVKPNTPSVQTHSEERSICRLPHTWAHTYPRLTSVTVIDTWQRAFSSPITQRMVNFTPFGLTAVGSCGMLKIRTHHLLKIRQVLVCRATREPELDFLKWFSFGVVDITLSWLSSTPTYLNIWLSQFVQSLFAKKTNVENEKITITMSFWCWTFKSVPTVTSWIKGHA